MIGLVTRLKGTPGVIKGSAPRLGEHTREVLAEHGYGAAEEWPPKLDFGVQPPKPNP
jgi:crotonobetainyl-CoA:carnitine CoA-transferase CaiB-like acyl-CoA transferase